MYKQEHNLQSNFHNSKIALQTNEFVYPYRPELEKEQKEIKNVFFIINNLA